MSGRETCRPRSLAVGIVEDDPIMGESLVQRLGLEGWHVTWWRTGGEAVEALGSSRLDAIICDIRLPDMDGEQVYRRAMPDIGATPTFFVTGFGDIEQAVRLVRLGADDYVTKPFSIESLLRKLHEAVERRCPERAEGDHPLGISEAMRRVETVLRRVRDVDSPVVLVGEIGTGKEMAARFLHGVSKRRDRPFLTVDCGALAENSPIFGPVGDTQARGGLGERTPSLPERAGGGTLFLDSVADLPFTLQGRLLGLIRTHDAGATDGTGPRIVCSSRCDLAASVEVGRFRADLFYHLSVITVPLPALRYRPDDIAPLTQQFLSLCPGPRRQLTAAAEEALLTHAWPGNARELQNRIERALAMAEGGVRITARDLFPERATSNEIDGVPTLAKVRAEAERRHISVALAETGGEIGRAATLLGVSRTTLWEKMRRLEIGIKD